MRILLTNDDGIDAPGIWALQKALSEVAEVTVVAPLQERSTTGHTLTLHRPLRLEERGERRWGCTGYPADCVLVGLGQIFKEYRPDLVVSGINRGANLAQDIYYSGTVAAAREACLHHIPAIAVSTVTASLYSSERPLEKIYYQTAANFIRRITALPLPESLNSLSMLNINVPNCEEEKIKGVKMTKLGRKKYSDQVCERKDFRGGTYYWIVGTQHGSSFIPDSDCAAVEDNYISLTPLNLLTGLADKSDRWSDLLSSLST